MKKNCPWYYLCASVYPRSFLLHNKISKHCAESLNCSWLSAWNTTRVYNQLKTWNSFFANITLLPYFIQQCTIIGDHDIVFSWWQNKWKILKNFLEASSFQVYQTRLISAPPQVEWVYNGSRHRNQETMVTLNNWQFMKYEPSINISYFKFTETLVQRVVNSLPRCSWNSLTVRINTLS